MTHTSRKKVFICYSRKDADWLDRLRVQLKPLERLGLIETWDDQRIAPGKPWRAEIDRSLDEAGAAVLLVSADMLASEFVQTVELPRLLERAGREQITVFPVLVGACLFDITPLGALQFVHPTDKPLRSLSRADSDAILVRVGKTILDALGPLPGPSATATAPPTTAPPPHAPSATAATPADPTAAKNELTALLKTRFRQAEREVLLFRLGLDPEDVKLRPESREEFARAMVIHADNSGRLADLWDEVSREREVFLRGRANPFR